MANGANKGATFERDICRQLSRWWSLERTDDVFWRTAGSGAKATVQRRKGQTAFGQDGDMQATDPIGQPFIDLCLIEIKRGYNKVDVLQSMYKTDDTKKPSMLFGWMMKAEIECHEAGREWPWLIYKADRKPVMIFVPIPLYRQVRKLWARFESKESFKINQPRRFFFYGEKTIMWPHSWAMLRLDEWLTFCSPEFFIKAGEGSFQCLS